jgi:hypothetical protein
MVATANDVTVSSTDRDSIANVPTSTSLFQPRKCKLLGKYIDQYTSCKRLRRSRSLALRRLRTISHSYGDTVPPPGSSCGDFESDDMEQYDGVGISLSHTHEDSRINHRVQNQPHKVSWLNHPSGAILQLVYYT